MTPERWELISRIFNEAVALDGDERHEFIAAACETDATLAAEVGSLLSAHEKAGDFIENPIVENLVGEISEMPTLTGTYLGHYRIEKSIGRGGMGDVYLATDTRLDRLVALKKLPDRYASDPLLLKRLRTEARAAASLNHPNVATIYSVEEAEESRTFITMEYVAGRTLDSLALPDGMDIRRFLDVFESVAGALSHAHDKGVIHRDLKPGNIMITAEGEPKLLDFGLAQFSWQSPLLDSRDPSITKPGQIVGTPSYMSPEQAKGSDVDHRTDIFSLGVVMYEALTGSKPFVGQNSAEVISNILKTDPADVSSSRSGIPRAVSRLVSQCIEKNPSDRPQNMNDVRGELKTSRKLLETGTSTGSFARRLYRESRSAGLWLRLAPVILVIAAATIGWIYFSRGRDPRLNFEKMSMRRLSDTNNVGFAQIAPDGRSVAYATFEPDAKSALWIRRIDDPNPLQLVTPQAVQFWGGLGISPDGGQIFYIVADRLGNRGTLFKVSSLGGPSRKLVDVANDVGGLSSDGERILFVRYGDPSQIISVKTSDGTDEQIVLTGPPGEPTSTGFRDPQYSSDGHSVYFIRHRQQDGIETWSIEEISLNDRSVRTIFSQPERISEMAVLAGSDSLLVTAVDPVSNLQQIFDISVADGKKSRVTNDVLFYFGVSADRAGRNIVASQRSEEQRIWVGDAFSLTDLRPVSQIPNAYRYVDWTGEGRLVFDGYENNVAHIWMADVDGKNLQRLTSQDTDDSQPLVSRDGRYIIFVSSRSGRPQIWRMRIDGTDQKLLADVNGITQSPELSADGQNVVFEWLRDRDRSLVSVPIQGGPMSEIQSLSDYPIYNLFYRAESPNGAYVAQSFWDKDASLVKIAVRRTDSSAPPTILDIWPSLIFKWSPDSNLLYYRSRQVGYQPESELLKLDPQTGRSSTVLSTVPEYIVDISFSRDGKRAAVVRGKNISNAVLLTANP